MKNFTGKLGRKLGEGDRCAGVGKKGINKEKKRGGEGQKRVINVHQGEKNVAMNFKSNLQLGNVRNIDGSIGPKLDQILLK